MQLVSLNFGHTTIKVYFQKSTDFITKFAFLFDLIMNLVAKFVLEI